MTVFLRPACGRPMGVYSWGTDQGDGRAVASCHGCGIDISVKSREVVDSEDDAHDRLEMLFDDERVLRSEEVH